MLWYSLEAPRRGTSNEYPQHMFSWINKKNIMWIPSLICSYEDGLKVDSKSIVSKQKCVHYENTPIQIYWKFRHQKLKKQGSNEFPQFMFWAEIRKIMYTPVNPSFAI